MTTTSAQRYGHSIREAVAVLSESLTRKGGFSPIETPKLLDYSQHSPLLTEPDPGLVAWSIVSTWLTAIAAKILDPMASLRDAEEWFRVQDRPGELADILSPREIGQAEAALPRWISSDQCLEQLPYLLDPHGPGSRLSVMRDATTSIARAQKRATGVFYTPADVAEYMVKGCLDSIDMALPPTVYDPACGTGVFLRIALRELKRRYKDNSLLYLASECLFGTDVAPWAVEASAFLLLADILAHEPNQEETPINLWRRLRTNLGCIDTLLVDPYDTQLASSSANQGDISRIPLSKMFPAMKDGPTVIVGNPPYADLGESSCVGDIVHVFKTLNVNPRPTAEVYVAFLEQMIRLANEANCSGALVLPLSLASNVGPQFVAARQMIQETAGLWRFAFFDREPQALFGEDVKTRNTIVFWFRDVSSSRTSFETGPLRRWRRESRAAMFDGIGFTPVTRDIKKGIPKVEGPYQTSAFEILNTRWHRLEQAVHGINRLALSDTPTADNNVVFVGTTAYNFLNVFLPPPETVLERRHQLSRNQLYTIQCPTSESALAVFGILSSHLAYWWWHTQGDGFHVTRRFITDFPFGNDVLAGQCAILLSGLGRKLWSAINSDPTISFNSRRVSLAYNPNGHTDIRRLVDRVLVDASGLNSDFVDELHRFNEQMVAATPKNRSYLYV